MRLFEVALCFLFLTTQVEAGAPHGSSERSYQPTVVRRAAPANAAAAPKQARNPGGKTPPRGEETTPDNYQYVNCVSDDRAFTAMEAENGAPKVEILNASGEEPSRNFKFQLTHLDVTQSPNPFSGSPLNTRVFEVSFAKPEEKSEHLKVWKGTATVTEGTKSEKKEVTYIEQGPEPTRKVFVIQNQVQPRHSFFGNDRAEGKGTYYGMTVFDNQGNFVEMGSEIDASSPPQVIYKTHAYCKDGKRGEALGLITGDTLRNAEDPVVPWGVFKDEIPFRKLGADPRFQVSSLRSELNDPGARSDLAQSILGDISNLSPAREKFADSILRGTSYQNDPMYVLRQAILAGVKYIEPAPQPMGFKGSARGLTDEELKAMGMKPPVIGSTRVITEEKEYPPLPGQPSVNPIPMPRPVPNVSKLPGSGSTPRSSPKASSTRPGKKVDLNDLP